MIMLIAKTPSWLSRVQPRRTQNIHNSASHRTAVSPLTAARRRQVACGAASNPWAKAKFDWESLPPGSREVQAAFRAAEAKLRQGDREGGKAILQDAINIITEDYGDTADLLGILHTQLFQVLYSEGQYEAALAQAQAAYEITVRAFGAASSEARLHGMRLGIALLGCGDAEGALMNLMAAGSMLEGQARAAREELRQAQLQGGGISQADMVTATHLVAAYGEAKFYSALCMLRLAEPENVGQADRVQQMLLSGAEELASIMAPQNDVLRSALREHRRLVDDSQSSGDYHLKLRLAEQDDKLRKLVQSITDPHRP